jgi:hypothetical protein
MVEEGIAVPEPSDLDDLENDPGLRQGVAVLVTGRITEQAYKSQYHSDGEPDCRD